MSIKILQDKFDEYSTSSVQEEQNALAEIVQEIALSGLSRSDFFKKVIFQGGTCLRILYGLGRFSEDLDFILKKSDPHFEWELYFKGLESEFNSYGIEYTVQDRSKVDSSIKKAFLKTDSIGKLLNLKFEVGDRQKKMVKVKFEVDTNPPKGSRYETKYLDFPFPFPVTVQGPSSLFAGKSHALLRREYVKGRDWYDFVWYVSRKTPLNFEYLSNAIDQLSPWQNMGLKVDKKWYIKEMKNKIETTDWNDAKNDIVRFLKPKDIKTIEFWSEDFFLERLKKLEKYL